MSLDVHLGPQLSKQFCFVEKNELFDRDRHFLPAHILLQVAVFADGNISTFALVNKRWHQVLRDFFQFYYFLKLEHENPKINIETLMKLCTRADSLQELRFIEAIKRDCLARKSLGLGFAGVQKHSLKRPLLEKTNLSRFGRWFALYHMLSEWRVNEPAIQELRSMIDFYRNGVERQMRWLSDPRFLARVEDLARTEVVLNTRRFDGDAPEPVGVSKLGGVADWPRAWLQVDARRPVLIAQIDFAALPRLKHMPRNGTLFVYTHELDSTGHPRSVEARFWSGSVCDTQQCVQLDPTTPCDLNLSSSSVTNVSMSRSSSASSSTSSSSSSWSTAFDAPKQAFEPRAVSFAMSVSLPPPDSPAVPTDLDKSAYAFVRQCWLQSRAARGAHTILGHAACVWDAERLVQRQAECDDATYTQRQGHQCGRDIYGLCGRRPLLSIKSTAGLAFVNGGRLVVWRTSLLNDDGTYASLRDGSTLHCSIE